MLIKYFLKPHRSRITSKRSFSDTQYRKMYSTRDFFLFLVIQKLKYLAKPLKDVIKYQNDNLIKIK